MTQYVYYYPVKWVSLFASEHAGKNRKKCKKWYKKVQKESMMK